jgi:hypothetical protein
MRGLARPGVQKPVTGCRQLVAAVVPKQAHRDLVSISISLHHNSATACEQPFQTAIGWLFKWPRLHGQP